MLFFFYSFSWLLVFFLFFFLGFFIVFFGDSVISLWCGMEVVSFFLVVFLFFSVNIFDSPGAIVADNSNILFNYFIVQIVGGVGVVLCILCSESSPLFLFFLCFFLLLNLSSFPSHNWVIELYSVLTFFEMFIVSVLPNMAPIIFLFFFSGFNSFFIVFVSLLSILFGGVAGLGFSGVRYILSLSSVISVGWLVLSLFLDLGSFFLVLSFFFVMTFCLYLFLNFLSVYNYISGFFIDNSFSEIFIFVSLLLGFSGLPLSLIFVLKFYLVIMSFSMVFSIILLVNVVSVIIYGRFLYWCLVASGKVSSIGFYFFSGNSVIFFCFFIIFFFLFFLFL